MGKTSAPRSIEHLSDALRRLPVELDRAVLFGSRARGNHWKHSDWDVVLVSKDFEGVSFPERISSLLLDLSVRNVELFCYMPDEFEEGRDGFGVVGQAVREGIDLLPLHARSTKR